MIYEGDCLEIMPTLEDKSIDAVVTDPPFAITGGLSNGMTSRNDTQFFEYWFTDVARQLIRVIKPEGCMFIWCDWRTVHVIDSALSKASKKYVPWWVSQVIVHNREMIGMGNPFRNQCDWIAVIRGKKTIWGNRISRTTPNIFSEYSYYGKHDNHPAEKTESALQRIIEWASKKDDIILDPFAGSGTTGVACINTGRKFILIEKDAGYCEIIRKRIGNTMPLFRQVVNQ